MKIQRIVLKELTERIGMMGLSEKIERVRQQNFQRKKPLKVGTDLTNHLLILLNINWIVTKKMHPLKYRREFGKLKINQT